MLKIAPLFLLLASPDSNRIDRIDRIDRLRGGSNSPYAFFEFAPASGVGMTAPCACTNPTGTKGEALTLNRASSAFCTKGHVSSGIANGDLVSCGNNLARVMPGGDGTGVVGLLIEIPSTNVVLRSAALDNAAWTATGVTAAAPSVTADNATSPDGTATAERVDFAATAAGEESSLVQTGIGGAGFTGSTSLYIKGVSGSGTIDICTNTGAADTCTACAYVSATWTRCTQLAKVIGAATDIAIGNLTRINGGTTRSANNVYIWGVQTEAGGLTTSYIATAGATASRATETSSMPFVMANTSGSVAFSVAWPTNLSTSTQTDFAPVALSAAGPTYRVLPDWIPATTRMIGYATAGAVTKAASGHVAALTENRAYLYWTTTTPTLGFTTGFAPATETSGTWTTPGASTLVELGSASGAFFQLNGVIKKVCVDPSPSRCR